MKKLNNKGLTAIEVLVCFAIISVIVISMLNIVNNYKNKQNLESYKSSINTYKTTLTKAIYDDIINNKGVINVSRVEDVKSEYEFTDTITLEYMNNKKSIITIYNYTKCFIIDDNNNKTDKQECIDNNKDNIDNINSEYYISLKKIDESNNQIDIEKFDLPNVYGLKYNDINLMDKEGIISIRVGLWHPELGTKYNVLNIITPNVITYPGML